LFIIFSLTYSKIGISALGMQLDVHCQKGTTSGLINDIANAYSKNASDNILFSFMWMQSWLYQILQELIIPVILFSPTGVEKIVQCKNLIYISIPPPNDIISNLLGKFWDGSSLLRYLWKKKVLLFSGVARGIPESECGDKIIDLLIKRLLECQ